MMGQMRKNVMVMFIVPIFMLWIGACSNVQEPGTIVGPALTTQPGSAATDVPVDIPISVTFNKQIAIDEATLTTANIWLLREGTSPRNITLQFDADSNQLLIQHDLLEEGMTYTVALTNYITSKDGESLGKLISGTQGEGAAPSTPTVPSGSFGNLGALVQSGGQALVTSVANAAYAWQFTTTVAQVADLGGTGPTEPATPPPAPPPSPPPSNQPVGAACTQGSECTSRVCASGICQAASCDDAVKNGDESDEDCGGLCDTKCVIGKLCRNDGDCLSNRCDANVCVEPEDGSVADGGFCLRDDHCLSGMCDTASNTCNAPACDDDIQNADETDIDCGGPTCDACLLGKACGHHDDCASGICSPEHICIDIPNNFVEAGDFCTENVQCKSGVCAGEECHAVSCSDGIRNGNESDVDCGPGCPPCSLGQACTGNNDCASGLFCENSVCAEPHDLAGGENCTLDPQCTSNFCDQGVCAAIREWTAPVALSARTGRPTSLQLGLVGPEATREVYLAFRETDPTSVRVKARVMKADVANFAPGSTPTQPAPGCSNFDISQKISYQTKQDNIFVEETLQYGDINVRALTAAYNAAGKASVLWMQDMDVERDRVSNVGGVTISLSHEDFELTQLFEQKLTEQTSSASSAKIWPPTDVGEEFETGLGVKMAMDNDGNILAAYKLRQDLGTDTVSTLWLIYYDKSQNEWTHVSPISYYPFDWAANPTSVLNFEIAMDPESGDAVVVWRQMYWGRGRMFSIFFDRDPDQPNQHYNYLGRLDEATGWDQTFDDFELAFDHDDDSFVAVWRQAKDGEGDQEADFRWARLERGDDHWGPTNNVLTGTQRGEGKLYAPQLAIDDYGHMFLVWKQYISNQHYWIKALRSDPNWLTPRILDERTGASGFTNPQLAVNHDSGEAVVGWMAFNVANDAEELRVNTYLMDHIRHTGWRDNYHVVAQSPDLQEAIVGAGRISQQLKSDIMTVVWRDRATIDNEEKYVLEYSQFYLPPD